MNVRDYEVSILSQTVGLVFQNPENQLFAMTVEEDVAFGPENLGLSRNHIIHRVEDALQVTGMTDCKYRQVFNLPGSETANCNIWYLCNES
jgi:energy-coupling factor transporter ATP-binding protein EcfA2